MQFAALVFIVEDGRLLMVKQGYGQRFWSLPGGLVEPGETLEAAAVREVAEESGLEVVLTRTVGIYLNARTETLAVTYAGRVKGGDLKPGHEISRCAYFAPDEMPSHARSHFKDRLKDFLEEHPEIIFHYE
ncbi:MAG: NUDIX domain-containing protein [Anaerolineales bacterium]|jgi:8-oxo-dGTP diphosphatase